MLQKKIMSALQSASILAVNTEVLLTWRCIDIFFMEFPYKERIRCFDSKEKKKTEKKKKA